MVLETLVSTVCGALLLSELAQKALENVVVLPHVGSAKLLVGREVGVALLLCFCR